MEEGNKMPILIILGIVMINIIIGVYEGIGHNKYAFTMEELERLQKDMCGKSNDECAAYLRKYKSL